MTETDPEFITGPGVEVPEPIDTSELEDSFVSKLSIPFNGDVDTYDVFVLRPDDEMPIDVAKWLRYRSLSENTIAAENEADTVRFKDVDEIRDNFLKDKRGRTIYFAVDQQGSLSGVTWMHGLANDETDFLLVAAGLEGANRQGATDLAEEELATFATREYGKAKKTSMARSLACAAIAGYFEENSDYKAVVGRYGNSDSMSSELLDQASGVSTECDFRFADSGTGWIAILCIREDYEYPEVDDSPDESSEQPLQYTTV